MSYCPLSSQVVLTHERLSYFHKDHPYHMEVNGQHYEVGYWPGDSRSGMFGGNSNWRGMGTTFEIMLLTDLMYRPYLVIFVVEDR